MKLKKYPQYYCVDFEIFIKLVKEGKEIAGYNHLGSPYPVGKAIIDGQLITKEEFESLTLVKKFPPSREARPERSRGPSGARSIGRETARNWVF